MGERKGDWCQTFSGVQSWPLDMRVEDIKIEDIAHALSQKCRFNGHCTRFYSVGQHSWSVSCMVEPEHALWGLFHDAAEAYLVDLPRPLKQLPEFAWYRALEKQVQLVVCDTFGLQHEEPASVKYADTVMLMTEKRDIMAPAPAPWGWGQGVPAEPRKEHIAKYDMEQVESMFLARFWELTDGAGHVRAGG